MLNRRSIAASTIPTVLLLVFGIAPVARAQVPATVEGYVVTVDLAALAPDMKAGTGAAPEAQMLMGKLKDQVQLKSRIHLAGGLSRQEILSTDFVLPAGTLVLHKAGDKYYVIADPKEKTYLVMDSEALLNAFEGGAGIMNSQYSAKVTHSGESKTIAGQVCRKSQVNVTYVSSIPFENDRVMVQQTNSVEVWHTRNLVSAAAMDHFFFKFQRDKTGTVRDVLSAELGFPMEVHLVTTQGSGAKRAASQQPGSLHVVVSEARIEKKLDPELFRIPPAGYRKIEKNPYFTSGAQAPAVKPE